jgi:hypothetical protein
LFSLFTVSGKKGSSSSSKSVGLSRAAMLCNVQKKLYIRRAFQTLIAPSGAPDIEFLFF